MSITKGTEGAPFAAQIRDVLAALGEDTGREGLVKTPDRVEASLRFLTQGYHMTVAEVIGEGAGRGGPAPGAGYRSAGSQKCKVP